ncbi:ion channel [Vibrio sp. RE86]|uniref:ion channel n=1 Tax=Vibrio sp. RE86 TaxID=2607605 RepID=UPI001493D099
MFAIEVIHTIVTIMILLVLFFHFIYLNLVTLAKHSRLLEVDKKVLLILQSLLLCIFSFAVFYYYLQAFSGNLAIDGIHAIDFSKNNVDFELHGMFRVVTIIPPIETIVDCLYFSVVTISTLGFGEMLPKTILAKIVVMLEVVIGFVLMAVSIGTIMSKNSKS